METLNIEKFSPKRAEIIALAEQSKDLIIAGIDDKEGYKKVHEARIKLKNTRVEIQKTGKLLRADALAFQKEVIEKEKELVALVEPVEKDLADKQQLIDEEKEKIKRQKLLPERQEKLKAINTTVPDDLLLTLDDERFTTFYNQKHSEYLAEKERLMQEEQLKIEQAKRELEAKALAEAQEKQRQLELEAAKVEAAAKAKRDLEQQIKLEAEAKAKKEADDLAEKNRQQAELEKQTKYKNFLKKNGYTEENKSEYHIEKQGSSITLYKKVDVLTLS